jgi:hypothetical protein
MNDVSRSVKPKYIVFGVLGFLLLAGLWYAFRPEKLFINKKVDEAAPAQAADQPKPLFTGRFSGEVHKTSGRATVLQAADGSRILRLSNFSTSNGPALHVLLLDGHNAGATKDFTLGSIPSVDLGALKGNQGDQDYPIPNADNLQQLNTVSIYCERFHANFGTAPLEAF